MEANEKIILLKKEEAHISDSDEAQQELLDTRRNKYVRKDATGLGATTSVLNDIHQNWLVVSPNIGMIKSKAHRLYQNQEVFFIYGKSKDKWKHVIDYVDNHPSRIVKINTTPDQIVIVKTVTLNFMNGYVYRLFS